MDRAKVVKGLEICSDCGFCESIKKFDLRCPYRNNDGKGCDRSQLLMDALSMLKEQEAVKPVRDEQTGRMWLCGKCGSYVGFEDNDPHDPNEFDKYCRECGRPVLWEGR